jgi:hypothetical protein
MNPLPDCRAEKDPAFRTKPKMGVDLVGSIGHEKRASRFAQWWLIPFTGRALTSKDSCGKRN